MPFKSLVRLNRKPRGSAGTCRGELLACSSYPARSNQLVERRPSELDVSLIPILVPLPRPGGCSCQVVPRACQQAWPGTRISGGGRLVFLSRAHRNCGAISDFHVLFCLRQKIYIIFLVSVSWLSAGDLGTVPRKRKAAFFPRVKLSSQKISGI